MNNKYEIQVFDYIEKKTGRHVVKAKTMYAGKPVYAFAKCDVEDVFDLDFGTKVALKRLDIKIAMKRAKTAAHRVKGCQKAIDWLTLETKRMKKARESAEILYTDRKVELKELESELASMLSVIND